MDAEPFFSVEFRGRIPVLRISGDIDLASCDELRRQMRPYASDSAVGVILDLRQVSYIDSTGVRTVFEFAALLDDLCNELVVVVDDVQIARRIGVLAKLESVVPIEATLDRALARLGVPL